MCRFVVNVKEILSNFSKIKGTLSDKVKVCVVLKANAYGLGAAKIASLLEKRADYFAVARLSELVKLREVTKKPCILLSPLSDKENRIAIKYDGEVCISGGVDLVALDKAAKKADRIAKVHIALDTGMNRFGFKTDKEVLDVLDRLKSLGNIRVVGCYSHLYSAEDASVTKKQRERFEHFKKLILSRGLRPLFHLANSEGLKNPENQFDMVRVGFDMFASKPVSDHKFVCDITEIKRVQKGETVSYRGAFKAKRPMTIAICSAGYADGVNRLLSSRGKVLIRGCEAPIVGDVCMDSFMADITNIAAKRGDEVVIFGKSGQKYISPADIAKLTGTIAYEVLCSISARVKRIYTFSNRGLSKFG